MFFAFSTITTMVLLAIFVPKRISAIEIYASFFFAYWFGITTDIIFDLKYELYGYVSGGVTITGLVSVTAIYLSINTLFLNYFPYKRSLSLKMGYIFVWSIFAVCYESIVVRTDFFYYNGWKLWYSAILYPLIYTVLALNLLWIRKLLGMYFEEKEKKQIAK